MTPSAKQRPTRWLLYIAIGVGLLLAAAVALVLTIDVNRFRPMVESKLSEALGRQVKIGRIELSILSGGVAVHDVSVSDDPEFRKGEFVEVKTIRVGVDLWSLIRSRSVNVTSLTLDQPVIFLARSPNGTWNFSSLLARQGALPLTAGSFALSIR